MTGHVHPNLPPAGGRICWFRADHTVVCHGSGDCCFVASNALLTHAPSHAAHDKKLAAAAAQIHQILDDVAKAGGDGRQLSILHTSAGPLLAWAEVADTVDPSDGFDPGKADPGMVLRALGHTR